MREKTPTAGRSSSRWQRFIDRELLRLSQDRAPVIMTVLGVITGLLAGAVVIAFRLLYESGQGVFLAGGPERFETLEGWQRLTLTLAGAALIGLYLQWLARADARTGIAYVIERTAYHQALLPVRNAIHQFVAGAMAIVSGQSVGREGPSVHLGGTAGSQVGQRFGLPNNSLRVLVACGTAAAIGASFNTPLAGVAFAMEVVVMEYTIAGFLPVIVASVVATALAHGVFGADIAFVIPALGLQGLHELPLVIGLGLAVGGLAALFIRALRMVSGLLRGWPVVARAALGGGIVGLIALPVPQVMGIGYDTLAATLNGEIGTGLLLAIIAGKLVATVAVLGLGIPGGLIGPTLVIGAAAGGALGLFYESLMSAPFGGMALYVLLGMGAMMGATLRAPLAALIAMLELTANPGVIMPGMLAIAAATMATRELFRTDSVYHLALGERGLDPRRNPLLQAASRLGVLQIIDTRLTVLAPAPTEEALHAGLAQGSNWLLQIGGDSTSARLYDAQVLARQLADGQRPSGGDEVITLDARASLREALERLRTAQAEALVVTGRGGRDQTDFLGVVSRTAIQQAYLASSPPGS